MTDWERCLKLNVLAPMAMTHAFSPGMVKRKVKVHHICNLDHSSAPTTKATADNDLHVAILQHMP